ncbi:MAG: hypothetical protein J6W46_04750 [Spirochaetaceae bacterium]|nr:hypothetical protein [Spirochaetaceae bacterium]
MNERIIAATLVVFYFLDCTIFIRQELKNRAQEQRDAVIMQEIADLKKKTRINAQDVDFLEKLVIEGKE